MPRPDKADKPKNLEKGRTERPRRPDPGCKHGGCATSRAAMYGRPI